MRKGIGVSPGVAVGRAYCVEEVFVNPQHTELAEHDVLSEWRKFEQACDETSAELRALQHKVTRQIGRDQTAIFQTQESVLRDPAFITKVRDEIFKRRRTAPLALEHVFKDYDQLRARTKDAFLKQRLLDVHDVIIRLSGHLSPLLSFEGDAAEVPHVLVARELLPWHIMAIGGLPLAGIVTQTGGRTSHAAILARRRGIPAVTAARDVLSQCVNGDLVVVDGRNGTVIVNPDPEQEGAYRKLQREFVDLRGKLAENRDRPARTADGVELSLLANINGVDDAQAASAMGARGVGLYRTEYLFLSHPAVPSEDEQLENYRQVIQAAPDHRVTIRTLDLGGDKTIPFLGHDREANPFMGWRSIRLSFEHPEFFLEQIRAVLRAAASPEGADAEIKLLFPMITTLEEIRRIRNMVRKAGKQLAAERKPYRFVPFGLMLEVPAAAFTIDSLLREVDFVSIGSNDLVQYLMAADRDNPKVSHLCEPLSPAVLRVLQRVIQACNRADKPVNLCGEMAGDPRSFLLLLGMGLRNFSMSPALIPTIKNLAAQVTLEQATECLRDVLAQRTTEQVRKLAGRRVTELAPNLELLDSTN
ncbi:MAG: phosphoenolpyruvate--protein phosphotransferase [Planctomycetales bacterium]|nr:phosphoenolpyruvate--protein phosphotransferase [Planctomycetales bacterium]MBN8624395.1 phosphoenolpyruvate--protein phosphotransferase [Planctomycetota bacterium]